MHESAVNKIDGSRKKILDIMTGTDIKALEFLDGVTALQPASTDKLIARLTQLLRRGVRVSFAFAGFRRGSPEERPAT